MKKCSKCGETKDFTEFHNNKRTKDGKHYWCKVCARTKSAEWKRNNRKIVNAMRAKWRAKAQPCVYRIKNKVSGHYYLGQTTKHFCERVRDHFGQGTCVNSPFTGLNKEEWKCEVLCYGTKKQVRDLEKALLNTKVGEDPLCLNRRT
jgi:hypothetical protein